MIEGKPSEGESDHDVPLWRRRRFREWGHTVVIAVMTMLCYLWQVELRHLAGFIMLAQMVRLVIYESRRHRDGADAARRRVAKLRRRRKLAN